MEMNYDEHVRDTTVSVNVLLVLTIECIYTGT